MLLLADRAGLHAVKAEILKSDESSLIEAPEVHIPYHLLLFLGWALSKFVPKTDGTPNAIKGLYPSGLFTIVLERGA